MSKNSKKFRESVKDYNAALEILNAISYEQDKNHDFIDEFLCNSVKEKYGIPPNHHLVKCKKFSKFK